MIFQLLQLIPGFFRMQLFFSESLFFSAILPILTILTRTVNSNGILFPRQHWQRDSDAALCDPAVLHLSNLSRGDHIVGFGREGNVDRNNVALFIQLIQRAEAGIAREFLFKLSDTVIADDHIHVEAPGAADHILGDNAVINDTQSLLIHINPDGGLPGPFADVLIAENDIA